MFEVFPSFLSSVIFRCLRPSACRFVVAGICLSMFATPSFAQTGSEESSSEADETTDSSSLTPESADESTSGDSYAEEATLDGPDAPAGTSSTPAPAPSASSSTTSAEASPDGTTSAFGQTSGERYRQAMFGRYRVRLGASRVKFDDGLKFYDTLYGKSSLMPMLAGDWFAWDWYVTFGLSFRLNYYYDRGNAARATGIDRSSVTADQLTIDDNQKTTLTLVPLQLLATAQFTPFSRKWIVLDGWAGLERTYFRESRVPKEDTTKKKTALASAAGDSSEKTLTNRGFRSASVVGASVNILLNWLDDQSARSMESAMGLRYVYVSPFMEIVRTLEDSGVSFGRSSAGVAFTFESAQ